MSGSVLTRRRTVTCYSIPASIALASLVLLASGCSEEKPTDVARYAFVSSWGDSGSAAGQFNEPKGIAIDHHGNVYVADAYNYRVQKFDGSGRFLTAWGHRGLGDGEFENPWAIAIDGNDDVYVTDRNNHRIQRFDADGHFKAAWGSWGVADGFFSHPRGIAVDSRGGLYVVEGYIPTDNNRIQKDDGEGTFLLAWGTFGTRVGQFDFSANTHDEAATRPNSTRFDPLSVPVLGRGPCGGLRGVAVDSHDEVYVADLGNDRVQVFDASGRFLRSWGRHGTGAGQFIYPQGIAVGGDGRVFVNDGAEERRVQVFDRNGRWLGEFGASGSLGGQFSRQPVGIAVNEAGEVYVADTGNSRIQKFAPVGGTVEASPTSPAR